MYRTVLPALCIVLALALAGCTIANTSVQPENVMATGTVVSINGSVAQVRLKGGQLGAALNPLPELKVGDEVKLFQPSSYVEGYNIVGQREIVSIVQ